jgi:hypothetical protein
MIELDASGSGLQPTMGSCEYASVFNKLLGIY